MCVLVTEASLFFPETASSASGYLPAVPSNLALFGIR